MTDITKVPVSFKEYSKMLEEREEARSLARAMYQTLIQFPTAIDELIPNWPQDEPIWLWRTP